MTDHTNSYSRPFPYPCAECGKLDVWLTTILHNAEVNHDGRLQKFNIPKLQVQQCKACSEIYFDHVTDEQISQALREHLSLLSPEEIRERLADLGLTQKEFGQQIRVAEATISRWLSGAYIQSGSSDASMRMFFELEEMKHESAAGKVIYKAGTIAPWRCQSPYQFAPISTNASPETNPFPHPEDLALSA